jgi:hypothetical protein
MKQDKRFLVVTTTQKHAIFLNACEYLNFDIHSVLNSAMKDASIAALNQMELEGVDTDDARKELLKAWHSKTYIKMPDSVILEPSITTAP